MHTSSPISISDVDTGHTKGQVSGLIYPVQSQEDNQHPKSRPLSHFLHTTMSNIWNYHLFEYFFIVASSVV